MRNIGDISGTFTRLKKHKRHIRRHKSYINIYNNLCFPRAVHCARTAGPITFIGYWVAYLLRKDEGYNSSR